MKILEMLTFIYYFFSNNLDKINVGKYYAMNSNFYLLPLLNTSLGKPEAVNMDNN